MTETQQDRVLSGFHRQLVNSLKDAKRKPGVTPAIIWPPDGEDKLVITLAADQRPGTLDTPPLGMFKDD